MESRLTTHRSGRAIRFEPENADDIHLPASDQPCKECKRRRAKCDRGIPECSTCVRAHRHCLYERHSRTPLTRKHLTQVEARLERAEALLRQYRLADKKESPNSDESKNFPQNQAETLESVRGSVNGSAKDPANGHKDGLVANTGVPLTALEEPSDAPEDLEWNEQSKSMVFGDSRSWRQRANDLSSTSGEDSMGHILDGMALLSVDGKEVGYVGVASGAAFLRYLWQPSNKVTNTNTAHTNGFTPNGNKNLPNDVYLPLEPSARKVIADSFVDAYFSLFHPTLPIIHEPSFRAIYEGRKARPSGPAWTALANIVAALGSFSAMTECLTVDTPFFYAAKSSLSIGCLETGSLTLVQALILMSYYFQKRNKPNSGYTYAGLAVRTAFGLGLHRELPGWNLPLLKREIRRRVFWSVFVVDASICVTLSRPVSSVRESTDIPFPLNVREEHINEHTETQPDEESGLTIYTALRAGATFYLAADSIYKRLIKLPFPDLDELIALDAQRLGTWHFLLPPSFRENVAQTIGDDLALAHHIAMCRYRNLRMIMFRPFLIPLLRKATSAVPKPAASQQEMVAYEKCLTAATDTISATHYYWEHRTHTRLAAWYCLYFSFQATLIPLVCLRNAPYSEEAQRWRNLIHTALDVIEDVRFIHASKCASVIHELADPFIEASNAFSSIPNMPPIEKPPDRVLEAQDFSMLFPTDGCFDLEADVAWQMVWPDAAGVEPGLGLESDVSAPSTADDQDLDLPDLQMDLNWPLAPT